MVKKTEMVECAAMIHIPNMAVSYESAHHLMQKFSEDNDTFEEGAKICISFRGTDRVTHSFLFGLSEYINANPKLQWNVQHSNHPDEFGRALEELSPRVRIMGEDETPYRKFELKRL